MRCFLLRRNFIGWTPTSSIDYMNIRRISWSSKSNPRSSDASDVPDGQEDLTNAAILDKVMKGRQPTDLMLRCASYSCYNILVLAHSIF